MGRRDEQSRHPPQATQKEAMKRSAATLLLVVLILVTAAGLYAAVSRFEQRSWERQRVLAAERAAERVAGFTEQTLGFMRLYPYLDSEKPAPPLPESLLEAVHVSDRGHVLTSIGDARLNDAYSIWQAAWFAEATAGRVYVGDVRIDTENRPFLVIALPTLSGVVAGRIDAEAMWHVAESRFGDTGHVLVINEADTVVAAPDSARAIGNEILAADPSQIRHVESVPGTSWRIVSEVSVAEAIRISSLILRLNLLLAVAGGGLMAIRYGPGLWRWLNRRLWPKELVHGVSRHEAKQAAKAVTRTAEFDLLQVQAASIRRRRRGGPKRKQWLVYGDGKSETIFATDEAEALEQMQKMHGPGRYKARPHYNEAVTALIEADD